MLQLANPEGSY